MMNAGISLLRKACMWRQQIVLLCLLAAVGLAGCSLTLPWRTPAPADTPEPTLGYTHCGWVWASQPLPEVSALLEQAFKETDLPVVSAAASLFGENCLRADATVDHFAAMQSEFSLQVAVIDLDDEATLGDLCGQVLRLLEGFPLDKTLPKPGHVSLRIIQGERELNLSFSWADGMQALDDGLRGAALFTFLRDQ
jgi:hypothetical protein